MSKTLYTGVNCNFVTEENFDALPHQSIFKKGRQTIAFENAPRIVGRFSVVGEKEGKGPLGKFFHKIVDDDKMHEKTFEKAEIDLLTAAIYGAADDYGIDVKDIDLLIAGDQSDNEFELRCERNEYSLYGSLQRVFDHERKSCSGRSYDKCGIF